MQKKLQVTRNHYSSAQYDSKGRFISYWHQIHEVANLMPDEVLEIGIGNAFVATYLQGKGIRVVSTDLDINLSPDVVANIREIPFKQQSFDVVLCCQVLEHIPYTEFRRVLGDIFRLSRQSAVISLPDVSKAYRLNIHLPKVGEYRKLIPVPHVSREHRFDGQHYWEIGKRQYPLKRIQKEMERQGFAIDKTYRVFECPFHRFFVLRRKDRPLAAEKRFQAIKGLPYEVIDYH